MQVCSRNGQSPTGVKPPTGLHLPVRPRANRTGLV